MNKAIKITVPPETWEEIKKEAERVGITPAVWCRTIIMAWLSENKEGPKGSV